MNDRIAGAFDRFAEAHAAAAEMLDSGFAEDAVCVCSNPDNPDGAPYASLAEEAAAIPGIVERLLASLVEGERLSSRVRAEEVRRGGVVVSVRIASRDERSIAHAILYRRRAVELARAEGGVPIY